MSVLNEIDQRAREIFRQIVESYLETGSPVGSRNLSRALSSINLSPASIRNVMADLEALGLIFAPHTSAGRLPTELGLRFFVDALMQFGELTEAERQNIEAQVAAGQQRSFEHVLTEAGDLLSGLSRSAAVVQSIATDRFGIGYGGIGARSAEVRPVPLAWTTAELEQGKAVPAVAAKAYSGEYPMARFLYLYVDLAPGTELEPLRREFLRYILSRQGQTDVVEQGYLPLPAGLVAAQIVKFLGAQ